MPIEKRASAKERLAFQRNRVPNIGDCRAACVNTSSRFFGERNSKTSAGGKLCCSLKDSKIPSSEAALGRTTCAAPAPRPD